MGFGAPTMFGGDRRASLADELVVTLHALGETIVAAELLPQPQAADWVRRFESQHVGDAWGGVVCIRQDAVARAIGKDSPYYVRGVRDPEWHFAVARRASGVLGGLGIVSVIDSNRAQYGYATFYSGVTIDVESSLREANFRSRFEDERHALQRDHYTPGDGEPIEGERSVYCVALAPRSERDRRGAFDIEADAPAFVHAVLAHTDVASVLAALDGTRAWSADELEVVLYSDSTITERGVRVRVSDADALAALCAVADELDVTAAVIAVPGRGRSLVGHKRRRGESWSIDQGHGLGVLLDTCEPVCDVLEASVLQLTGPPATR